VTGRVAWDRNATPAGNQLNLPLDNVDKVGMREQQQNNICRVRNPGTRSPNPLMLGSDVSQAKG
jgi:hypothetical protein